MMVAIDGALMAAIGGILMVLLAVIYSMISDAYKTEYKKSPPKIFDIIAGIIVYTGFALVLLGVWLE